MIGRWKDSLYTIVHILLSLWGLTCIHKADWVHPKCDKFSWRSNGFYDLSSSPYMGLKCPRSLCSIGHAVNTWLILQLTSLMEGSSIVGGGKLISLCAKCIKGLCIMLTGSLVRPMMIFNSDNFPKSYYKISKVLTCSMHCDVIRVSYYHHK